MSDEFGPNDGGVPGQASVDGRPQEPLFAESLLEGFATGGLPGLLHAMDDHPELEEEDYIEDPEALRAAEEAVAHDRTPFDHPMLGPIDESWVHIASQTGEALVGGLRDVADALDASGIPVGWDPYDPRDAPSFTPPLITSVGRTFSIAVPASRVAAAREVLAGPAPAGVTYTWERAADDAREAMAKDSDRAQRRAEAEAEEAMLEATDDPSGVTLVTGAGRALSDNARMQAATRGPGPGSGALVAVLIALLILGGIVAFVLLRG